MKSLEEKSLNIAALVPFQKNRGMLKFLRTCVTNGKINAEKRDAFEEVFIQSVNQIERKWRWTNWRVCDEIELKEKLMDLAWEFITSEESLIAVLLSRIMPIWNEFVKDENLTLTMDRLLLYTKYINSASISESCNMFLKLKGCVNLENEASFTCLPLERVMFSCLMINDLCRRAYVENEEAIKTVDLLYSFIENEKLGLNHKFIMAVICGSEYVLDRLWHFDKERELPKLCNELSLYLISKPATKNIVRWLVSHGASATYCDSDENTLLHLACKAGCKELIEDLLNNENGVQIDVLNKFGKTPLHKAAETGHISIIKMLLERGAKINMQNKTGNTPLQLAVINCETKVVETLLAVGASADLENSAGYKLIEIAINKRHVEIIKILLDKGSSVNSENCKGETCLHVAILLNDLELVKFLVGKPECDLNKGRMTERVSDETPLHLACQLGFTQAVQIILESNGNATLINSKKRTALHEASWNGRRDIVELLLSEYDPQSVNQQDYNGKTALHLAAEFNEEKSIVSALLDKGADASIQANLGETALILASKKGNLEIVEQLLSRHGQDSINSCDKKGKTALLIASECNKDVSVVAFLISKGADVNMTSNLKETVLMLAAKHGHKEIVELILSNCDKTLLNQLDQHNKTALHYAVEFNNDNSIVSLLLSEGADVNLKSKFGETVLMLAAKKGHVKIVELILSKCDKLLINDVDRNGRTALHYAAEFNKDKSVVSLLITKGADVNIKSKSEETALMLAMKQKHIFELILSKCDKQLLDHADKNGKTALHYAAEFSKDKSVVLDLINVGATLTKRSKNKQTPLFLAASRGHKEIVKAFIDKCNRLEFLNSLDINGLTALGYAAENGHWDVVFALANKKASVNVDINQSKMTPLHKAVISNNINVVRILLDKGAKVDEEDSSGKNALNYSEELELVEITQLLKKKMGK